MNEGPAGKRRDGATFFLLPSDFWSKIYSRNDYSPIKKQFSQEKRRSGAGDRIRTDDNHVGNVKLYH